MTISTAPQKKPLENWRSRRFAYSIAAGAVVASTAVQLVIDPYVGDTLIFSTYFAAIVVAAVYGGFWPGVLAILLSVVAADWFFVEPRYSLGIPWDATNAWTGIITFCLIAIALAAISEALHRNRAKAYLLAEQRAAAMEAATAQRELLHVTLSSIGDAVIATDEQGRISFMNSTAEQLLAWTNKDASTRTLKEVFHIINERTRLPAEDPCLKVLRTGRVVGLANHTVLVSRDGTERPIDDSAAPIRDENGTVRGVVVVFRDATTQRRTQEINERFAAIVEHSDDAIIAKRLDGTITSWNSAAERLYGYTAKEAIGQPISIIVPPERRDELQGILKRLQKGERIDHLETVRMRRDGTRVDVSLTISALKDEYGNVIGASKIARDISEQKKTHEALQRSEEHARFLSEASKSMAALVDVESSMQRLARLCAPRFADWCAVHLLDEERRSQLIACAHGDPQKESVLMEVSTRYPPDWRVPTIASRVLGSGEAAYLPDVPQSYLDSVIRDARHAELIAALAPRSVIAVPLESRGRTIGVIGLARTDGRVPFSTDEFDVAQELARRAATAIDNCRLYDELRSADRQKDDFLAMLAHELRNPLAAIDYATQLSQVSPEQAENATDIIHRQVRQLSRLIDDLLDVSRITRNKIELQKENIDAAALVNRAAGTARPVIEEHKHRFDVEVAQDEMPLHVDPTRVEQVIVNLLTNAAKYTPAGGHITLKAQPEGDQIVVKVKDTGAGIPREMLPRVFELFTQVNPQIDRTKGGLGIGLTVVRRLTEMHCGTVSATSEGLGKGSEFTVRLPRNTENAAEISGSDVVAHPPHGLRVLVVEDNVDMARSLALLLKKAGCETQVVHDGAAALEVANSFPPQVVLLDIGLPGLDGYEVARRFRADPQHAHVRLIAVSGYGQLQDQKRSKDAGFNHHLVKPVAFDALLATLAK
jgi:PAS domain S-box-containing protein